MKYVRKKLILYECIIFLTYFITYYAKNMIYTNKKLKKKL